MNIYELWADSSIYPVFVYKNESEVASRRITLNGEVIGKAWMPPEIELFNQDYEEKSCSDMPGFYAHPVFSEKATEALKQVLIENGELLPLPYSSGMYYLYNTTKIIDVLNESESKVKRYSSGRIMRVLEYQFVCEKLKGVKIFKIPQLISSVPLVTDEFVDQVKSNNLSGLLFKKISFC